MALLCSGYPFHALQPASSEVVLIHMFEMTSPKLVFSDLESYTLVEKCLRKSKIDAKIYTFCGQVEDSLNVDDLFAETGMEEEFV